ncbi:hypothetical protein ST37_12285 [Vibrio sp. qd031]|nr:hypothetical protein ST37_12285 [Vibrio sp. qd031]
MDSLPIIYLVIIVSAWLVIIGIATFVYSALNESKRKRTLSKYGMQKAEESKSSEKGLDLIVSINEYLSRVLSTSDEEIKEKLGSAGIYSDNFYKLYIPIKYGLLLFSVLGVYLAKGWLGLTLQQAVVTGLILVVVILLGPDFYVDSRIKSMQKKLSDQLPYLIDMMGICVQTGMTIEASISYLAQEMKGFDEDIAAILAKTSDKARVIGLEGALEDLYKRVPTPEFRSFVMTLNQSLQYGSSISQVLTNLAMDIREVQMLTLEERIGSLSAKMSIPLILFIMIPIVILITAPGIMRLMG